MKFFNTNSAYCLILSLGYKTKKSFSGRNRHLSMSTCSSSAAFKVEVRSGWVGLGLAAAPLNQPEQIGIEVKAELIKQHSDNHERCVLKAS